MTDDISIRECQAADIEDMRGLEARWAAEGIAYGYATHDTEELARRLGPYFLIAERGGRIVGFIAGSVHESSGAYAAVTPIGDRYLEVDDLYVLPELRSRGIGGRLLEALLDAASSREGIQRIHVFSASKHHDKILAFYRAHGFRPWGVQLFK